MKTYKLLKFIEPETSIPIGDTFQAGDLINLDNWNTIPADWLIQHWYIEEVKQWPTRWEELWSISWYDIVDWTNISFADSTSNNKYDAHIFKTKEQAEAAIALAQITQLLDKYDIPEESYEWYYYAIGWHSDEYKRIQATNNPLEKQRLLRFDTEEKRDHFYKHHGHLIEKLAAFGIY